MAFQIFKVNAYYSLCLFLYFLVSGTSAWFTWTLFNLTMSTQGSTALASILAAAISLVFLSLNFLGLLPLTNRSSNDSKTNKETHPYIWNFVTRVSKRIGVQPPAQIRLCNEVNAYASFHSGLIGLLKNDTKLTIGNPLIHEFTEQELTAIIGHELGHIKDVNAMRACCLAHEIEGIRYRTTNYLTSLIRERIAKNKKITLLDIIALTILRPCELTINTILRLPYLVARKARDRLLEEMEIRADKEAAKLVGNETVLVTMQLIQCLCEAAETLASNAPGKIESDSPIIRKKFQKKMQAIRKNGHKYLNKTKAVQQSYTEIDPLWVRRIEILKGN
ncbi:M48 family metalloprotease [Puniceicoccaceae bacterium K14]|nr:M48 family metalloprotease [Puniceicoccaceae bacterium K14]